jgi:hypothetical protein
LSICGTSASTTGALTQATPLITSAQSHCSRASAAPAGSGVPRGAIQIARSSPGAEGRKISFPEEKSRHPSAKRSLSATVSRAFPIKPRNSKSALASLRRSLARSTNMLRRFTVAASTSAGQISSTSVALGLMPMKLASMRPLGEHSAAKRACAGPSNMKSWVSWPWRKRAASSPSARMTPRWGSGATPLQAGMKTVGSVMASIIMIGLHQAA